MQAVEKHSIYGGKVHVYRRENSGVWQCSAYIAGKNRRKTTGEASLQLAKEFAEDWYLGLKGKVRDGVLKNEKTFKEAATQFKREYEIITEGERSPIYVKCLMERIDNYLIPYFGNYGLSEITAGLVQEYRIYRQGHSIPRPHHKMPDQPKPPSRSTMHTEIVALRHVLKTALRHGWMSALPDFSMPYKTSGKITRRAWFSPDEYKKLYEATRAESKKHKHGLWKNAALMLHDYVLFMVNTGLRPDEASRLEYRDVAVVKDKDSGETILEIEVRGKRGVGYCKSMPGAVQPFKRLKTRASAEPTDPIFPTFSKKMFNRILEEANLKVDREGQKRTAYSLRHTYICFRLMEGADIYQVAKNCRTSVEMIQKYYADHIKTLINAAAVNVRRKK